MKQMKTIILFFALAFFNFILNAQNSGETLFKEAQNALSVHDYATAIQKYEEAANAFKTEGATENYLIASVNELDLMVKTGDINHSEILADKLNAEFSSYANNPELIAHFYSLNGRVKYITGQFEDALSFFKKALKIRNDTNAIANAFVYSDMSLVYSALSKLDSAIYFNKKSIQLIEKNQGKDSPNLIYPLINLSNVYIQMGRYDEAITMKKKILNISISYFGENSEETAEAYSGLGKINNETGEYNVAKEYLLKALEIMKNIFGENSYKLVPIYFNLGNLYYNLGNLDFALQYYFLAAKTTKQTNENNVNLPDLYNNIALVCKQQNNYDNAEIYFDKAYQMCKQQNLGNSLQAARILANLGNIYMLKGEYQKATETLNKALQISSGTLSEHNVGNALVFLNMAQIYLNQNNPDSALIFLVKSINANYKNRNYLSLNDDLTLDNYYNGVYLLEAVINIIYAYQIKYSIDTLNEYLLKADYFINKADSIVTILRRSYMNEQDKIQLNTKVSRFYEYAVNAYNWIFLSNVFNDDVALSKMFYFIERNKSTTLLEAINEEKIVESSNIPDSLRNLEMKLKHSINYSKQKLSEAQNPQQQAFYRNKYLIAQDKYAKLLDFYKVNYPDYYNAKFDVNISTIQDIQNMLDDTTAMLNYSLVSGFIYIMVITNDSAFVFQKEFNPDDKILVKNLNLSILSPDAMNIKNYLNYANLIYKKIFPDSLPKNIKRLIIIPDDILSTVSFESLLTEKVEYSKKLKFQDLPYLIKKYNISYSFSATLFEQVNSKNYSDESNKKFIFALAPVFRNGNSQTYDSNPVSELPGTEKEVKDIASICDSVGLAYDTLLNRKANEYLLKKYLDKNKYKIIHIATHGMVNFENPDLSALILSRDSKNIEDGLLYSGEIYSLRIPADLVVLSACETARGKISKGEGVIGLSRAFLYAGTRNMIISLWKVSDIATTREMDYFYRELVKNPDTKNFGSALHSAKLQMINSRFAHPYFWSGFILIGQ